MTVIFPRQATAVALVEAAFPAGDNLTAADPAELLDTLSNAIRGIRMSRPVFAIGLLLLDLGALIFARRRFHRLDLGARQALLARWGRAAVLRDILRLIVTPYRLVYIFDADRQKQLAASYRVQVPTEIETPRWRQQVMDAADAETEMDIDADVVVIGTGAGGAVAAYQLASAGLAVVMIEEGRYWDRRHFTGNHREMTQRLYRMNGITGSLGNAPVIIPMGRAVGGTTTINSGTCFRTPPQVLADWRQQGFADLTPDMLAPHFEAVEAVLEVQPGTKAAIGPIGDLIQTGASKLGFTDIHPLDRNASGCDGQALCQFGCPTDAKRSTNVSYVPKALEKNAFLFTRYRATKILRDGDRVAGVLATGSEGAVAGKTLRVKARAVVVAMGSLLTPIFLRENGVRHPWLGRNLSIHPCGGVSAWFPGLDMHNTAAIPQGFGIGDWAGRGIRFEGGTPPLPAHALAIPQHGPDFIRALEQYRETAFFGFMIKDESRGRVYKSPVPGLPLVRYSMNRADLARYVEAFAALSRIYFAAGASAVSPLGCARMPILASVKDVDDFAQRAWKPNDFIVSAYHPLGTARLGLTPGAGVIDPNHQVYGHTGLYVMDGSAVPSSLGVNPQITIMTLANRAAERLAQHLSA